MTPVNFASRLAQAGAGLAHRLARLHSLDEVRLGWPILPPFEFSLESIDPGLHRGRVGDVHPHLARHLGPADRTLHGADLLPEVPLELSGSLGPFLHRPDGAVVATEEVEGFATTAAGLGLRSLHQVDNEIGRLAREGVAD